jgi:hypothetical protein
MIRAGGVDRLEQHNRECTRISANVVFAQATERPDDRAMIHCHVAVYKVSFAPIRVNSRQFAVDSSSI